MKTDVLYRPVGPTELARIVALRFRGFPPRLSWQPIFYPVLNFAYAEQIARDWNARSEEAFYCGFVTKFEVDSGYLRQFEIQTVGAAVHQELWVPAEELATLNSKISGLIQVVAGYFDKRFDKQRLPEEVKQIVDEL